MAVPTTMKALVQIDNVSKVGVKEINVPPLEKGEILVKVDYVAINPTDWKHVYTRTPPGAILGCDFSGTVVASADSGERDHVKVGTRVAGWVHGNLFTDRGSFAEYLKVPGDLAFVVPDNITQQEAATYGIPYFTAFHALVHSLKKDWPPQTHKGWALVYGGSTSVGFYAIQLAKLLGYKVVTTCSPRNFDLVKQYGANAVFDYRNIDECVKNIREVSGGGVDVGIDCVSEGTSQTISIQSFNDKQGHQLNILLVPDAEAQKLRPDVKIVGTLLYTVWGKAFNFGPREGPEIPMPALPQEREWFKELIAKTPEFISVLGIRPAPFEIKGGLEDIPAGFELMKNGKVSAQRLVYKI